MVNFCKYECCFVLLAKTLFMAYIQPPKDEKRQQKLEAFDRLLTIMDELRLNCPWDQKQTLETIRPLTIEEVYELGDAIIEKDIPEIKKELGDVMLHLIFYSKIADEKGDFDIADVLHGICDKMINRHPHIYSDTVVENEEDVKTNWEKIKLKEGSKGVLSGVPKSLPAMVKSTRIQSKARGVGFDWNNEQQVWDKVEEELQEFKEATTKEEQEKELGDVFFSIINFARFKNIDPEYALELTNKKFVSRFNFMENEVQKKGLQLSDLSLEQMDEYWNEGKKYFP